MAGREAAWLAAALILPAVTVALASPAAAEAGPITAEPRAGDAGLMEGHERLVGPDGRVLENHERRSVWTWTQETIRLPSGAERSMPTLTRSIPAPNATATDPLTAVGEVLSDPAGEESDDETGGGIQEQPLRVAYHHASLDEPPKLFGFDYLVQDRQGEYAKVTRVRGFMADGCHEDAFPALVQQAPRAAEERLERCLAGEPTQPHEVHDVDVDVHRVEHPARGPTWAVDATVERTDPDGRPAPVEIHLVTSSALPLPLEQRVAWQVHVDGEPRTVVRSAELTGWRAGDEALEGADPLPERPTVPLVRFTEDGPVGERLEPSFAQAREQVREDPRVATYLDEHPEAETTIVRHVERHADERSTPAATTGMPTKCRAQDAPEEAPTRAAPVAERGWSFYWRGDAEDMIAYLDAPTVDDRVLGAGHQVRTLEFEDPGVGPGLGLPREVPSLAGMRDHLGTATSFAPQGDPFAGLLLTGTSEGEGALYGFTGRVGCTVDPHTGNYTYEEGGLMFQGRQAAGSYGFVVLANEYGALASALGTPPPQAGGDPDAGDLGPLAIAGALVAGTMLAGAGSRAAASLYSRLETDEVVEHPLRADLLDAVQAEPGATLPALADALDANRDTLAYHARMLERHDLLVTTSASTGTILHPKGHPAAPHADALALQDADRALAHVLDRPGPSVTELSEAIDVPKSRASELASALAESGLVEREENGRALALFATPAAERVADAGALDER